MAIKLSSVQALGRVLMLPIALLPVAGLLLRFGQPDLLNIEAVSAAGQAIFSNLPLLFAIGVSVGFAKDNNGAAGLAGVVGYLIFTAMLKDIDKSIDTGVLGGIVVGSLAGFLYNRYKDIKLPEFLAFFGGKRFVPIITGILSVILGGIFGVIWPPVQAALHSFSVLLSNSGEVGLFLYGFCNRLLLATGFHHVFNSLFWFQLGDFTAANGTVVHGDIARFMAGDPTAGYFQAGYFPIMMFGLPAICFAMYVTAYPQNRKAVAGLLLSMALTSFLTGVTEPIEYSFMFLAPILYVIHAVLTGISLAVMELLHVRLGFSFSAGAIDYVLFFKIAHNPLYMIPVGIAMFVIYASLGIFFIKKFNLATIGRESQEELDARNQAATISSPEDSEAVKFITALGGSDNLLNVDACTTRLRLVVRSPDLANRAMLKVLGAKGFVVPSADSLQVILGPQAEIIAGQIRETLTRLPRDSQTIRSSATPSANINPVVDNSIQTVPSSIDVGAIVSALGNKENIKSVVIVALTRVKIEINKPELVDVEQLKDAGILSVIDVDQNTKQLYVGSSAKNLVDEVNKIINC